MRVEVETGPLVEQKDKGCENPIRPQLTTQQRQEDLHPGSQAHLLSVIKKICSLLEYQGAVGSPSFSGFTAAY